MRDDLEKKTTGQIETVSQTELLPVEMSEYFAGLYNKHFIKETAVGSLFTGVKDLTELLSLAQEQRKDGLAGDDRVKFAALGVAPDSLMPSCRYLLVKTPGVVGVVSLAELADDEPVYVNRIKPGAPCTLNVVRSDLPATDVATIIIGPNEQANPSTREMIWTVHPGLPIRPAREDFWEDGSTISTAEVKEKLGNDKWLNVRQY